MMSPRTKTFNEHNEEHTHVRTHAHTRAHTPTQTHPSPAADQVFPDSGFHDNRRLSSLLLFIGEKLG